jgi:hypothetical protein
MVTKAILMLPIPPSQRCVNLKEARSSSTKSLKTDRLSFITSFGWASP